MEAVHRLGKKILAMVSCLMLAVAMVPVFGYVSGSQAEAASAISGGSSYAVTNANCKNFDSITFNGKTVYAVYPVGYKNSGSDTTYCCAAFVKKFYQTIFGVNVWNLQNNGTPSVSSGSFSKTNSPVVGDIVATDNHWGIVKAINGNTVTVIEQNWSWMRGKTLWATRGRTCTLNSSNATWFFHWSNFNNAGDNDTNNAKPTLAGASYPTSLQVGQCFGVKGTVSSSSKITAVSAAVYNSAGKWVTGGSAKPNTTSFNLVKLDNYVRFDKLSAGTYTYAIYATNSAGQACLLSKKFSVAQRYSQPTLSGANYPTSIKYGRCFGLYGTIYGNGSNLRSVTAAVYTTGGAWKTGKTLSVNTGSVNIAKSLDNYVLFNKLPRRTYVYKVIATNSAGTYTLLSKQFKVY